MTRFTSCMGSIADHEAVLPRFDKADALGESGNTLGDALVSSLQAMKGPTRASLVETVRNMNKAQLDLLLPGITLNSKDGQDRFLIESLGLFRFDGTARKPLSDVVPCEGRPPRT